MNRLSRKPVLGIKISSLGQLTATKTNKGKSALYYIMQQVWTLTPALGISWAVTCA